MTVTVSAWFGVAFCLSSCFWLGVWARPKLASLRRLIGGSPALGRASGRGKAGTVERVRTYTGCLTDGQRQAGWEQPLGLRVLSRTTAPSVSTAASAGSRGADKPRADAPFGEWVRSPHSRWERRERTVFGQDEDTTVIEWRLGR